MGNEASMLEYGFGSQEALNPSLRNSAYLINPELAEQNTPPSPIMYYSPESSSEHPITYNELPTSLSHSQTFQQQVPYHMVDSTYQAAQVIEASENIFVDLQVATDDIKNKWKADTNLEEVGKLIETNMSIVFKELHNLETVFDTLIIDINQLKNYRHVKFQLEILMTQLEIYRLEVFENQTNIFRLVYKNKPSPVVLFKGKPLGMNLELKLLHGLSFRTDDIVQVEAKLASTSQTKAKKPLINHINSCDRLKQEVSFMNLKFNLSTRVKPINLCFHTDINTTSGYMHVESDLTDPFVVITSEGQWAESLQKLILIESFEETDAKEISWSRFCNILQLSFVLNTKPKSNVPERSLKYHELLYLQNKILGGRDTINTSEARAWISKFVEIMKNIRFSEHVYDMWVEGLIYFFASRETCETLLMNYNIGSFIIRFSESTPGKFAIAYVSEEGIKHHLIKSPNIPDYIKRKKALSYICKIDISTGNSSVQHKDLALGRWYKEVDRSNTVYEEDI
eukprot:TRINITY_DN12335_c0_g1_i1.p1 TRINITY_DN12335_c0_g1~~TRINITY_DN12335_c0_g1_i1.p1  ORF type:complete len:532 (-),score=84.76 TRINITY_DN12335_c0_g1_i1:51-1583(-)